MDRDLIGKKQRLMALEAHKTFSAPIIIDVRWHIPLVSVDRQISLEREFP